VEPTGPNRRYVFSDLVALRVVRSLLDVGLPLQRIRKAVAFLADTGEELAGLRLVSDGSSVLACRTDGEVLDALRGGQLALFVSVGALADDVEGEVRRFSEERDAFVGDLQDTDSGDADSGDTGEGPGSSSASESA